MSARLVDYTIVLNISNICKKTGITRYNIHKHYDLLKSLKDIADKIALDIENNVDTYPVNYSDIDNEYKILKMSYIINKAHFKSQYTYNWGRMPQYIRDILWYHYPSLLEIINQPNK